MSRYDLTDFEWRVIEPLLPNKPRGVPRLDDRRVLNGIFWVLRSGAPWRDLPERYGPRTTCYNRFVRWRKAGAWDRLMNAIFAIERSWNTHISTAKLNRWLGAVVERHPPPAVSGRRLKLRYMTQAKMRPPSFIIFASRSDAMPTSYLRYLTNSMRETFDMPGTPIRLWLRSGKNPYAKAD